MLHLRWWPLRRVINFWRLFGSIQIWKQRNTCRHRTSNGFLDLQKDVVRNMFKSAFAFATVIKVCTIATLRVWKTVSNHSYLANYSYGTINYLVSNTINPFVASVTSYTSVIVCAFLLNSGRSLEYPRSMPSVWGQFKRMSRMLRIRQHNATITQVKV